MWYLRTLNELPVCSKASLGTNLASLCHSAMAGPMYSLAGGHVCMRSLQDTAVISGREQARLQEELELIRRQVAQLAHVMQVSPWL